MKIPKKSYLIDIAHIPSDIEVQDFFDYLKSTNLLNREETVSEANEIETIHEEVIKFFVKRMRDERNG